MGRFRIFEKRIIRPGIRQRCSYRLCRIHLLNVQPYFLIRLIRAQGGSEYVAELVGTASQAPSERAKYSAVLLTAPYFAISRCMTSSTGAKDCATLYMSQFPNVIMS